MGLNLHQLEAFVNVSAEGSMTRAASKMALTQSAISVLVRQFEESCKIKLFDRSGRGARPTALALAMLPAAQTILSDVHAFERRIHEEAARDRGTIDIAVTPSVAATVLPDVLQRFSARFPDVRFHVHDGAQSDVMVLVSSGSAAFGIGTFGARPDIDRLRLLTYPLMLVCKKEIAPTRRRQIAWAEVAKLAIVSISRGNTIRTWIDDTMQQLGLAFEPTWEVAQFASAIAVVRRANGYTILPGYLDYDYAALGLVAIELVKPRTTRDLFIITQRNAEQHPATPVLTSMIQDAFAKRSAPPSRP
jgi:LysR family transcriptional regulator, carnitine catabolism transcriptional activator